MKRMLNRNEQVRVTVEELNKLYEGLFVFATNFEVNKSSYIEYCVPRLVCSSRQELTFEDTQYYKENEKKYGTLAHLDFVLKPDLLFM